VVFFEPPTFNKMCSVVSKQTTKCDVKSGANNLTRDVKCFEPTLPKWIFLRFFEPTLLHAAVLKQNSLNVMCKVAFNQPLPNKMCSVFNQPSNQSWIV
jgi:hypothetical protein